MKEYVPGVVGETVYENLNAEMEQFYNTYKDADEVKQEEIEKGRVRALLYIEIIYYLNLFGGEVSNICCFLFFFNFTQKLILASL